ncbi:hypothetical protein COV56_02345 [Candidatus Kuenenbacteria bacterium CG11_big_fil_rev_8_21_14_0_20_37_9]|nr:MAG: hypothetical protein COV56_02345 [Candidatus Kuenenbacteria bacterium CG11_big_fil_rev_8_21_14_0_20_37_9]
MSEFSKKIKVLSQSKDYPIHECLINPNWQEMGHARIMLSRQMPNNNLVVGVYMIDLYCLGLKDTLCDADLHQYQYEADLKPQVYVDGQPIVCDLNLAHSIIYGSIEYAKQLGFHPQRDFKLSQHILILKESIDFQPDQVEFGLESRPFFVRGPYDDSEQIIRTLEKTCGDGNFDVMCEEDGDILSSMAEIVKAGYTRPAKVGRNDPCPCNFGKKYKKCCGQ